MFLYTSKTQQKVPSGSPSKGFTLIELLVVVLIIGILSAIGISQYRKAVDRSRVSEIFLLGAHVRRAQQVYFLANGAYTTDATQLDLEVPCQIDTEMNPNDTLLCKESYMYLYSTFVSPHLTFNRKFWINMYYTGKSLCSAWDKDAEGLCLSLGAVYSHTDADGIKRYNL